MKLFHSLALATAIAISAMPAWAQTLTIGRASEPQSIDPLFSRTGNNQMTAIHIFDRLVHTDENVRAYPALAESWTNVDPLTWEVKLRQGVKFHDGSPLTAADVVWSMERAPDVPNSPASFAGSVADIAKMEIVDDHTIRFTSKNPNPLFIENIGTVYILSKAAAEGKANEDFAAGPAAIGTGPYKYVSWQPGDRLELVRNDDYWGDKPAYEKVVMRFISNDAARVAALLSGAVDLIDLVPPADLPMLRGNDKLKVYDTPTVRLIYLALNQNDDAPHITDAAGNKLDKNPFDDPNVRKAVSMMIDRQAIIDRLLYGAGEAASQIVPQGVFGYSANVQVPAYDPEGAKKLLAEAGYPEGFGITLHGSNDRFSQDAELAQVLGQFLARGGLKVNGVETLPYSVFSKDAGNNAYGAFIFSYGNSTGEASRGLLSAIHTFDEAKDLGTLNRFGYSNPVFDAAVVEAAQLFDPVAREAGLAKAQEIAFGEDTAIVPLYFQALSWASKAEVDYVARRDERTLAMGAKPAN